MKKATAALLLLAAVVLSAQATPEVEITNEGNHHLVLENELVRVYQVEVAPQQATLMHWHRHDYFYVTLGDSDVSNEVKGKAPVELKLKDGQTGFSPATFAHIARNLGSRPFRNVTIELMQDEKFRTAPAKWDEERGLHVLNGGTQEILFVKDNARVSEIELQPGGVIPSHHHNGPHLVIAVTDVDVRSDVEGKGATSVHVKSGDVTWAPGGYTHTVTNMGKQAAKFVAVEFP
jgi:mannose-6-phosphate isomerase-like protein (cupin superfamily)